MGETITYEVQIHEAGPDSKARVKTLFDYMQSAADRHSKSLGTSLSLMSGQNLTWVYTRFYTVVERYPEMYDKVYCKTWRSEVTNGLVSREFILSGENGIVYVKATSSLALIDRTSRKPVPIDLVYIEADNPISTVAKCYVPESILKKIKPGMKVYKRIK